MTTSKSPAASAPKRNRWVVTVDIVVAVFLALLSFSFGLYAVTAASQFPALITSCGTDSIDGLVCNPNWVSTWSIIIIGFAVFGFALTAGMVLVNIIRKRPVWFWPLIGIAVIIVSFYAGTALVSLAIPTTGGAQ